MKSRELLPLEWMRRFCLEASAGGKFNGKFLFLDEIAVFKVFYKVDKFK